MAPQRSGHQMLERQAPAMRTLVLVPVLASRSQRGSEGAVDPARAAAKVMHSPADRLAEATGLAQAIDLEVLDAERTLFDARRELLGALVAFHLAATDLERLTGTPLAELSGRSTP